MGMHPQLGALTDRHKTRLFLIKELGCTACFLRFGASSPGGDGHHAEDDKGTVIGHDAMICLCPAHHHRSTPASYITYGPSRHMHTVEFTQTFGTDLALLAIQNERLEAYLQTFVIRPRV